MAKENSVSEEIRSQRKKLKGQGFKAHWDYFWEYYKIHTIVAVVVVAFLISFTRQIINRKPYALYTMFINCAGIDVQTNLQEGFYDYAGIDRSAEEVIVDTTSTFSATALDTNTVTTSEKIMALMSAKDLDAIVADEASFFHFAGQENFADLRNIFSEKELEAFGDKVFYMDQGYMEYLSSDDYSNYIMTHEYDKNNKFAVMAAKYEETGEYEIIPASEMDDPVPVGIYVDDSDTIYKSGAYFNDPPVAGITINTAKSDNAKKFIEYLFK